MNQNSSSVFLSNNVLINGHYLKNTKITCLLKSNVPGNINFLNIFFYIYSYIFEISNILSEKPSISNEKPRIVIENLGFWLKKMVFQIKNFEVLGFLHTEFEVLSILRKIPSISKTWNFA